MIASSGKVYADTGYPNPEEAMAKAELAILISSTTNRKKLTQKKAGELIRRPSSKRLKPRKMGFIVVMK